MLLQKEFQIIVVVGGGQLIRELSVENLMVRVICDSFKEGTTKDIKNLLLELIPYKE